MKKISLTFCLAFLSSLFCPAQVSPLQFNKNGEFKIVQFTDIHFKYGNPASDIALKRIGEVLDAECPDLVVFTGDVVYAAPADTAMRKVLSYATDRKIPFVVTFGNHDNEQGKTRAELYDVIRSMPFNIQPDRGGVESPDYVLTLKSSDGKKAVSYTHLDVYKRQGKNRIVRRIFESLGYKVMKLDRVYFAGLTKDVYKRQAVMSAAWLMG